MRARPQYGGHVRTSPSGRAAHDRIDTPGRKLVPVSSRAGVSQLDQSVWGLRALGVLISPRSVFGTLRDDREIVANARQEAATALVLLGGVGAVLIAPQTGRLLDDPAVDGLLVAVIVLLQGFIYGVAGYWAAGALARFGELLAGGDGTYRRARHLVAFAAAPLALSLLALWPLRIALFGGDLFRTGGEDGGTAGSVFAWLGLLVIAWSLALVPIGLRAVHRWPRTRALGASLPLLLAVLGVLAAGARV